MLSRLQFFFFLKWEAHLAFLATQEVCAEEGSALCDDDGF